MAAQEQRNEARRRAVLDAAVRAFSERGYRATSMADLARQVGLSKPALYHYVPSKEQLLVELYEEVMRENVASVRSIVDSDRPVLDALREVIVHRVAYTCENRRLLRVFFEEEAELPRRQLETVRRVRLEYEDAVLALVGRAQDEGAIELPTSPRIFVNAALGAANWVYKWYDPRGKLKPRELGGEIASVLLAGLAVRPGVG